VPDLAARILAEIERVELAAGAATAGPWRHNPNKHWRKPGTCWFEEAVFTGPAGAAATCVAGTGESDHPQAMADARHIALNDPPTVLRRCAAGRRTLHRHKPRVIEASRRDPKPVICDYCSHVPVAVDWPCLDIVDLADVYSVTTEAP
jgi:hypothetical protein